MSVRSVLPAFVLDAVLLLIFASMGRRSHELGMTAAGLLETAWPFLAGLGITWVATLAWRAPVSPIRTGLPLWGGTLVIGMFLRVLTGAGTALPFVLVATGTIGLMLVGWRGLAALLRGMQGTKNTPQR